MGPLIAERVGCGLLVRSEAIGKKAGNSTGDREAGAAAGTEQHSLGYFRAVGVVAPHLETVATLRTSQKW
jgi:hypothetical protein